MAQSISSAQSAFLKSGQISNFGSAKDFEPRESLSALIQLAAMIIENAQSNLQSAGQVSSGALSDSFKSTDPIEKGNAIYIQISALDYYDFQNKGVKGTKGGSSSGGYAFKNAFPSQAMVSAIDKWIKHGHAVTRNTSKKHTISKNESKNAGISDLDNAYMVARSIKIKGIKGSGYFDKAVKLAQAYAKDILGKALLIDVVNAIPNKI